VALDAGVAFDSLNQSRQILADFGDFIPETGKNFCWNQFDVAAESEVVLASSF